MLLEYNRSRLYFYEKYYGKLQAAVLKLVITADMALRIGTLWLARNPQVGIAGAQTRYQSGREQAASGAAQRLAATRQYVSILRRILFEH
jgi:hypothetical protein